MENRFFVVIESGRNILSIQRPDQDTSTFSTFKEATEAIERYKKIFKEEIRNDAKLHIFNIECAAYTENIKAKSND